MMDDATAAPAAMDLSDDTATLYTHADAQNNRTVIGFYPDFPLGPSVCFDGGRWLSVESLREYISDLTAACDQMAVAQFGALEEIALNLVRQSGYRACRPGEPPMMHVNATVLSALAKALTETPR